MKPNILLNKEAKGKFGLLVHFSRYAPSNHSCVAVHSNLMIRHF